MAGPERGNGLQIIFSFFLGLMVTTFIGVGVYTFHPPDREMERRIQEINREERFVQDPAIRGEPTPEEEAEVRQLQAEREDLIAASQETREAWGRSTSIVLILLATLVMAVSLIRSDQLPVISNGLLLGGVFTMVYGVGWIVASDSSVARFIVVTVAFAITLGLGYVRFARRRSGTELAAVGVGGVGPAGGIGGAGAESVAHLEGRIRALEARMEAAARVLEGKE